MMAFDIRRQTFIRDSNGGIGIVFNKKDPSSHYSVENLLKGGPADMSGAIQVGDLIMSVNDMPISSLSVDKVVDLIKGTPSSSVILGLATPALNSVADDMTFEVVLKRGSNGGVGIGFATRDNSLSQDMQDVGPFYVGALVPGGAAQQAHRDYHLGFQTAEVSASYPAHVHDVSPILTLQGAVAHCDMPLESGPTKLLPFSQAYRPGYAAWRRDDFRALFEERYVQLPLAKGDAVFFSPALFHAA